LVAIGIGAGTGGFYEEAANPEEDFGRRADYYRALARIRAEDRGQSREMRFSQDIDEDLGLTIDELLQTIDQKARRIRQ
jgi:hypothetical protein